MTKGTMIFFNLRLEICKSQILKYICKNMNLLEINYEHIG